MRWLLLAILSTAPLPLRAQAQPTVEEQYFHQGVQLQKEGRYTEAVEAYTAALDEVERRFGPENIAAAQILISIGTVRALKHDDLEAKAAFEHALNITEKALGSEHVQVGLTLLTIAMLTHKQGHYAAAEPLYQRAFTILEKNFGPEDERTAFLEASMAKLYLSQRRNSEAEALLEKAIPVLENAGEPDEATLVVALVDLAEAYRRDGRYAKAEPLYAHILAMVREKPQALNHDIRTSLQAYVQMLRKMKRKTEAHELEQQLKTMLPSSAGPELKIEIHLYNYSAVTGGALIRVKQETARIFKSLGVEMDWRNCPLTVEQRRQNTTCDDPGTAATFTIRLLSNEMANRIHLPGEIHGFAQLPVNGPFSTVATVFADHVRELAVDEQSREVILGHFIAHELGHLLLGHAGHPARAGIMHIPWQTQELELAKRGGLLFLPEQAKTIRAEVRKRIISDGRAFSNSRTGSAASPVRHSRVQ